MGLSFGGALVLSVVQRHPQVPRSLVLIGAYAGWAGSLPREEVDERLRSCLRLSDLPPGQFVDAMTPSMFSASAPVDVVANFAERMRTFSPAGFRTMARASAEADLRNVLPSVNVPTLLLYGDQDVRAPMEVAEALHLGIPESSLVVMPGVGHASPVEAPERVSREIREFLRRTALA